MSNKKNKDIRSEENLPEEKNEGFDLLDDETSKKNKNKKNEGETQRKGKKKEKKPLREHTISSINGRKNFILCIMMAMFLFLVTVLYSLMVIDEDGLSQRASEQYTRELTLKAKRGTIYDRNMNVLAVDYTVYTVFISPRSIKNDIQKKLTVDGLVEILGADREDVEKHMEKKKSAYEIIAREVDEEKAEELRAYIARIQKRTRSHENPSGINLGVIISLEEETKRHYPYGSLAANVIGFVSGSSNSATPIGVCGIEAVYENILKGVNGKIVRAADGRGNDIAYKYETYIDAKDGQNIVLTIDVTVQAVLEKYLEEAYYDNDKPTQGVAGVIMDVNTGEVLASAKYPSFDLNEPRKLGEVYQKKYDDFINKEAVKIEDEKKRQEAINNKLVQLYAAQWSDKVVMEIYEPGSTFKIFTAAVALEEGVASLHSDYTCTSAGVKVGGWTIHCHKSGGHGPQTFAQTLQNSCNPAFVKWGQDIGKMKFLDYYESFGYTDKTGTDMYAESYTVYFKTTNTQFEQTELATYSFGQTFKTTMIQQIRGVSTVANGGTLVTPHACIGTADNDGNILEKYSYPKTTQVLSEKTSETVLDILEKGSTMGTTKNATVAGYSIAAKTGTSQKRDQKNENIYIGSCVAFAPANDPEIAILIAIDEPNSLDEYGQLRFYGGVIAAPVVSKVLGEVLPYLEIPRSDTEAPLNVKVWDYTSSTVENAKKSIESQGLVCKVVGTGKEIVSQMPLSGEKVLEGSTVILYTEELEDEYVTVPNFIKKTYSSAKSSASKENLNISYKGAYTGSENPRVASQSIPAGTRVKKGTVIELEFLYSGIVG